MTTAFARHLELAPDDSMEVTSSPAGNQYDDEVLIDYDDYGTATLTEDEHMIEDSEPARPGTATDDMMEDAEPTAPVNEEIMHDDPAPFAPDTYIEDEELIDYSDEDYQDDTLDDTLVTLDDTTVEPVEVAESTSLAALENLIGTEPVDDAIVKQLEDAAAGEEPSAQFLSAVETVPVPTADVGEEEFATASSVDEEETTHANSEAAADELARQDDAEEAAVDELARQDDAEEAAVDELARQDDAEEAAVDELARQDDAEEAAAQELGVQVFETDDHDAQATDYVGEQHVHGETQDLKHPPNFPTGLDTSACFAPDGPQTPSDTGIHPITVRYGDIVMPLFKSRAQLDGLLKDDNLASVSLGDLLDNCRHRLAIKIGENVSADQELVLGFENMGLQLVERSPHAFGTSLQDVLQVYLSLHRNDSSQTIPPLALSLSLQLKFTSSFNILKAAAEAGEGMSKFAFLRSSVEELDEYGEGEEEDAKHEDHEDQEAFGEDQQYAGEDTFVQEDAKHEDHEDQEAFGEDPQYAGEDTFVQEHANGEASHPDEGQENEEDQHPENEEESQEYDAGQSYEGHDDGTNFKKYDGHLPKDPGAESEHIGTDAEAIGESGDVAEGSQHGFTEDALEDEANNTQELEEPDQPESTASSATVRGDLANDATGEYYNNEDFIDFGDDDLTTDVTELHVDDGSEDFSTFVSGRDVEEGNAGATALGDEQEVKASDASSEVVAPDSPANEPSLNVLDDEEADADGAANETHDKAVNDAVQHGQDEDPPADNLDLNEEDLPAEDDEQLDPAFDLLEGHDFEDFAENADSTGGLEYDEDDIGFNDDVEEAVLASNSPLGKRSFDEHVDKDEVPEKPEFKRARS